MKPKFAVEIWQYSQPVTIGVRAKNEACAVRTAIRHGKADGRITNTRAKPIHNVIVRPAY